MADGGRQEVVLERFVRGWAPRNRPPEHLYPRDLLDGQVVDAMGVRVTEGGQLRWERNQLMIASPSAENVQDTKTLLEYRTESHDQLLAFVNYDNAGTPEGRLYKLETDWSNLPTPTRWAYGFELFGAQSWGAITEVAAAIALLPWWGVADAVQAKDILLITIYGAAGVSPVRWNGTNLAIIGLTPPAAAPGAAEAAKTGNAFPLGTYSYFFTYDDGEMESMPSPIADCQVVTADQNVALTGLTDAGSGTPDKKIYRAYTPETAAGTRAGMETGFWGLTRYVGERRVEGAPRGASFQYVATIAHGTTTYDDGLDAYALGDEIWFDRAKPPLGTLVEWHKERAFMSGAVKGSPSYTGYDTGYWGNVLFWSQLDEPYYWPGENMVVVGDDTEITGIMPWKDHLLIFKENSVWHLTGYDESDFVLEQLAAHVGSVAENSQAAGPPGVLWAAPEGYYFYEGGQTVRRVLEKGPLSPWGQAASTTIIPTIAWHNNRFYMMQEEHLLEWEPRQDRWSYRPADWLDADGYPLGLRAWDFGEAHSHLLTRMAWVGDGAQEIIVLDPAGNIEGAGDFGTTYSDLYAPLEVTLPPIEAPPGMEIVPLEVRVHGSWADEIAVGGYVAEGEEEDVVLGSKEEVSQLTYYVGDRIVGTRFVAPADGHILTVKAYMLRPEAGGSVATRVAIYKYSDLSKLGDSDEVNVSAATPTWTTYTLSAEVEVQKGVEYLLCAWSDKSGDDTTSGRICGRASWSGRCQMDSATFPTWPDPIVPDDNAGAVFSIYAAYTTGGAGVGLPGAVFGSQEAFGVSWRSIGNQIAGSKFTAPLSGELTEMHAFLNCTAGADYAKAAVYKASDLSLLGYTSAGQHATGAAHFIRLTFVDAPQVVAGTEYILVVWGGALNGTLWVGYVAGDANQGVLKGLTFDYDPGGFPDPLTTDSTPADKYSVCAGMAPFVKLFLNVDADYSETAGENAWEATPDAPQYGEVIGVPSGYTYDTSARTNARRIWYPQLKSDCAADFLLDRLALVYGIRASRGEMA